MTEKSIFESSRVFSELIDNMGSGVIVYEAYNNGKDFIIRDINNAGEKISNVMRNDILGKFVTEVFPGIKEFGLFNVFQKVWKTGKSKRYPLSMYKDDRISRYVKNYVYKLPSGHIVAIYDDITEQRRANEDLIKSEEKYQSIYNSGAIGVTKVSMKGEVLEMNQYLLDFFGYLEEEIKLKTFMELTHPEDLNSDVKFFNQLMEGKIDHYDMEKRYIHKDGHIIWGSLTVSLVRDLEGNPLYAVSLVQDITENKKAEEQLKESEERFRKIFEESPLGMAIINLDNQLIIKVNFMLCRMLGYNEKELIGLTIPEITHSEDLENNMELLEKIIRGDIPFFTIEKRYTKKDKKIMWGNLTASIIRDKNESPLYGIGMIADITEQKEIENKLKESEEELLRLNKELEQRVEERTEEFKESEAKYRTLFEQAADSIVLIDTETEDLVEFNDKMYENLGYSREEFNDIRVLDFVVMEENEDYESHIKKIIREGSDIFESKYKTKDGKIRDVMIHAKAIKIKDKQYIHSIIRDITEFKELEEKIKKSEEMFRKAYNQANLYKDIFAHDINNILQNIQSSVELSSLYLNSPEKLHTIKELYEIINEQVNRGKKLIKNIQKITEIDDTEIVLEKINATIELNKAIDFTKANFPNRNLNFQFKSTVKRMYILANNLLLDVFENILINAVRHNDKSNIQIIIDVNKETVENKEYIKIEFKDNGLGISDYRKKDIFEKGTRTTQKSKGMGLGLSLVKKIVDNFHGDIWVEDRIKGDYKQGCNFVVLLQNAE